MKHANFIGGEFVPAREGRWLSHVNPETNQSTQEFADSGLLDVVACVQAANKAVGAWQKSDLFSRQSVLLKIADLLTERADSLAGIQALDQGVPVAFVRQFSIPRAAEIFRQFALTMTDLRRPAVVTPQAVFYNQRLPIGVVGIITPWSDPFVTLALRVAPALAAGNVVIAKVSEFAPAAGTAFSEILRDAGLMNGVFNCLQGTGESVGLDLVRHPGISTLSFTGSTEVGRLVVREAAETLKRVHLALGARNPVIVFAGVELEKIMPQIVSATMGLHPASGLRGSRLFIQDSIYDSFFDLYRTAVEKLSLGETLNPLTQVGPLAHQILFDRYQAAIELALKEDGRLVTGGVGRPEGLTENLRGGFFVKPTVIRDLTLCSTVQQDEVIGPFVTVSSFKYQHDAVKQANTSPMGQAAYIFDRDGARAQRVAQKLEAGRIFVNTGVPLLANEIDAGGLKGSGLGQEGLEASLKFFSRETAIGIGTL